MIIDYKIITISNFTKNELCHYYPRYCDKISVIYNGINHNFKVDEKVEKKDFILYVGSLNPRKNFVNLIKAHSKLKSSVKLVIVGNFSDNFRLSLDEKEILKKARENKNIIFKQNLNQSELITLYQEAKVFVYPSFYEGFGIPPVEAMACGTPLIVSEYSAMQEVCLDGALYIDPQNIEDIKEKIQMLLSDKDLQKRLIKNGLKRAKLFNWKYIAKEHIDIIRD